MGCAKRAATPMDGVWEDALVVTPGRQLSLRNGRCSPAPVQQAAGPAGGASVVEPRKTSVARFGNQRGGLPLSISQGVQGRRVGKGSPQHRSAIERPSCSRVRQNSASGGQQPAGPGWPWDGGLEQAESCRHERSSSRRARREPHTVTGERPSASVPTKKRPRSLRFEVVQFPSGEVGTSPAAGSARPSEPCATASRGSARRPRSP